MRKLTLPLIEPISALRSAVGGRYRLKCGEGTDFHGTYLEVTPPSRLVWTNDESGEPGSVTTVTFEEKDGRTWLVVRELYPSKEALDAAGTGAAEVMKETFGQAERGRRLDDRVCT